MPTKLKIFAMVGVLAAGTSSAAMAQYACLPGYALYGGICRPVAAPVYPSNPVSGAIVGGAIGTATGTANGALGRPSRPGACTLGQSCNRTLRPSVILPESLSAISSVTC